MTEPRSTHSAVREIVDELQVQAWLARREFREPSLHEPETHEEATALARLRDEVRLQIHLGKLDARDEYEHLEGRWRYLMRNNVEPVANSAAKDLEIAAHDLLREIRDGYHKLLGR